MTDGSDQKPPSPPGEEEQEPENPLAAPVASKALERLQAVFPDEILAVRFWAGTPIVTLRPDRMVEVLTFLRDDDASRMNHLTTLFATHYPENESTPFEVTYSLYSIEHRHLMHIKVWTAGELPTVSRVWPVADWNEREAYDLLGVTFEGHPDMTRILMPDDWQGHPLRKDYPLEGNPGDHKTYR